MLKKQTFLDFQQLKKIIILKVKILHSVGVYFIKKKGDGDVSFKRHGMWFSSVRQLEWEIDPATHRLPDNFSKHYTTAIQVAQLGGSEE